MTPAVDTPMFHAALALAQRGWRVLPVAGKVPIHKGWPELATTDPVVIATWWTQEPRANIGIATGKQSNLFVLDVDPAKGGDDSYRALEAKYGPLPVTVEVLTGGGGRHQYFTYPAGFLIGNSASALGPGLDVKTDGGQVVAPPSIHPKTQLAYAWEVSHHPDDLPLAAAPAWLLDLLTTPTTAGQPFTMPAQIADGARNDVLYRAGRSMKAKGLGREAIAAALSAENRTKCAPPLSDREVLDIADHTWTQPDRTPPERSPTIVTADDGGAHEADVSADTWPKLDEAALYGLPGELVKSVSPYSEADPVGILIHLLVASGVMIGSHPHVLVEHMPHCARTNALLVGVTAGGRKGTAYSPVRHVLSQIDEPFISKRVKSGLSSGEGLIYQVRDPQYDQEPIREGGRRSGEIIGYEDRMIDPGEPDKRLLIIESEFASALTVMEREGNTLSPVLRDVWDHGNLSPLTKKDRMVATNSHVAVIGHITEHELLRKLTANDRANGVANRFLFALVRQSKFLPSGKGTPPELLQPYFMRFSRTLDGARTRGLLARDQETEILWASVYQKLAEVPQGLTGAILARGAAQVLRLSLIYALLDEAEAKRTDTAIRVPHLLAALAVWDYCKASAYQIFGDAVGDPVADRLLRLIKTGPQTDTDLYESLGKHEGDRNRKGQALDFLQRLDRIHRASIPTAGRAITEWHVGIPLGCALCAKRG